MRISARAARAASSSAKGVEVATRDWVEKFVVRLKLCPFAKTAMEQHVVMRVCEGNERDALKMIEETCDGLAEWEGKGGFTGATGFVVTPGLFDDFLGYMRFMNEDVTHMLEEKQFVGTLQIAQFHPMFMFEGNDADDAYNTVNRSPYPMFHILREEEVTRADEVMDTATIWARNEKLLRRLGRR